MSHDKYQGFEEPSRERTNDANENSVRARNRTVMLTPDITGQVRARLTRELDQPDTDGTFNGYNGVDGTFTSPLKAASAAQRPSDAGHSPIQHQPTHGLPAPDDDGFEPVYQRQSAPPVEPPPQQRVIVPPPPPAPTYEQEVSAPVHAERPTSESSAHGDRIVWQKTTPVAAFLVSYDKDPNGEVFALRAGRLIVTSEVPNGGNYLLLSDESVSPMHAIIRVTEEGHIQVLDQLSEFGTGVSKLEGGEEVTLSGDKAMVEHGDILRFGKRLFNVSVVIR